MGNCMETCTLRQQDNNEVKNVKEHHEEGEGRSGKFVNGDDYEGKKNNGVRVKVVLTREELNWLILQLNEKEGVKLEQVLGEIEKGREEKVNVIEGWKPSLESILEAPEMLEIIDR